MQHNAKIKVIPVGMLQANCALVIDEQAKVCAVVDPGANTQKILEVIEQQGVRVECILLTHGHFDHVMAAPELQKQTGAKLYIHKADAHMLEPSYASHAGYIREAYVQPEITGFLADGMALTVGGLELKIINTPGHTPGSCVILCGDTMLAGDTLFLESCGRVDLEGGSAEDMVASLTRLRDLPGDYTVYPGHADTTMLSHERQHNPYMPKK